MGFFAFLKNIFLESGEGLFRVRADRQDLSLALRNQIEYKNAVTNVKRLVPFATAILLIEVISQLTIFGAHAYPSLHALYLTAGIAMMLLAFGAILAAYRLLCATTVDTRRCKRLYRSFWWLFSFGMLAFIYLEIESRGSTNNFFYLLILTAAFPLLSWRESLSLFCLDIALTLPIALYYGFSPQQMIQLPLITAFSLILSRVLYNTHYANENMVQQLEISNQKLVALAQTDPLTGLLNRRGVQDRLRATLERVEQPCEVAFLMIDIDLFKSYNDRFGHDQGDVCLQKVADALRRCTQGGDRFASRIGGEEFLSVLVGCAAPQVLEHAQRLRKEVLTLALPAATDAVCACVTISVGIATARTPFDFITLYGQADKALYTAKHAGRNCVALNEKIYRDGEAG